MLPPFKVTLDCQRFTQEVSPNSSGFGSLFPSSQSKFFGGLLLNNVGSIDPTFPANSKFEVPKSPPFDPSGPSGPSSATSWPSAKVMDALRTVDSQGAPISQTQHVGGSHGRLVWVLEHKKAWHEYLDSDEAVAKRACA